MPRSAAARPVILVVLAVSGLSVAACCCPVPEGLQSALEDLKGGGGASTESSSPLAEEALRYFPADQVCDPAYAARQWCPVGRIGDASFPPPAETSVLLGLTVAIPDDGDRDAFLENATRLSVLTVGPSSARLEDLSSSDPAREQELLAAVASVTAALRQSPPSVLVPAGLAVETAKQAEKEGYTLTPGASGATFSGATPGEIWRVQDASFGEAYVVVEDPGQGVYVSVFPIVPNEAAAAPEVEPALDPPSKETVKETIKESPKESARPSPSPSPSEQPVRSGVKGSKVGKAPRGGKPRSGAN